MDAAGQVHPESCTRWRGIATRQQKRERRTGNPGRPLVMNALHQSVSSVN
jgi:hypothetical protein